MWENNKRKPLQINNNFSGRESIIFMADKFRAKTHSISQVASFEDNLKYNKHELVIGTTKKGSAYSININKSIKAIIIAPTGTGKTVLMQGIISRFYFAGGLVAIPTDIKGEEYSYCNNPLQSKYHKYLLKWPNVPIDEKPQRLYVKSFRPYFFSNRSDRKFPKDSICQFPLESLTSEDFLTIAELKNITPLQRDALDKCFRNIKEGSIEDLSQMIEFLDDPSNNIKSQTSRLLISTIENMRAHGVVGDSYTYPNFHECIKNNIIPVLNTYGTLGSSATLGRYSKAYVAIILRHLYDIKASGLIPRTKHLLLALDEIKTFCPNDSNPSSKKAILDLLKLSRSERISMIFAVQNTKDVPDILIDQASHIFIPCSLDSDVTRNLMERFAYWDIESPQMYKQILAAEKANTPKYAWYCIDRQNRTKRIFIPSMPLCYHREE